MSNFVLYELRYNWPTKTAQFRSELFISFNTVEKCLKGDRFIYCIYCCSLDEIEVGYGTCQEMRG